jgi:hypothetical protein
MHISDEYSKGVKITHHVLPAIDTFEATGFGFPSAP